MLFTGRMISKLLEGANYIESIRCRILQRTDFFFVHSAKMLGAVEVALAGERLVTELRPLLFEFC